MTPKERYTEWAYHQENLPIYLTPWWMDAVCAGKEWDVLLCEDKEGAILGAMPYLLRKRAWYKYIIMPQMTQTGGIWIDPSITADKWQIAEVCRHLKEQLDGMELAYYYQHFVPNSLCVEPMKALGFKVRERVTYRVDNLSNLDELIASFSKNKRRQLQKALSLHTESSMDGEQFYRFHTHCMKVRGKNISYPREFLLVLEKKAKRLLQCRFLSICNADGQTYAAAFLVWDKNYLYYLLPAMDNTYNDSGAGALLALEAMKLAREKHVRFDFEGSMNKGIAWHYKQFGSTPTPYYSVEKYYKPLFRILIWIQKLREWKMNR